MKWRCLDTLIAEHKIILRMADVLDSMAGKVSEDGVYSPEDVEGILNVLRVFGDGCHQAKEEGALFPVVATRCSPSEHAAVRHMLFEHQQDRSLMQCMGDAVNRSNAAQFGEYAGRLAATLRNHIYKEDNILFETLNEVLSAADDERVMADFAAFDCDFEKDHQEEVMHRLRLLEWKYLRNTA